MSRFKILNAMMMITGTSVGTGILGLPIVTSSSGFIPTLVAFLVAWVFMTLAAYYILEVKMRVRGSYNLSSMIKLTLGKPGQYFSSTIILLLLYALLCTYMMAGAAWLNLLIAPVLSVPLSLTTIIFTVVFALIILGGERFIYNINNLLGVGLLVAFIITVGSSLSPTQHAFINQGHFMDTLPSLPLLLTTFGFSIVVPAVTEYLDYNEKSVKISIMSGSLVAFSAYAIWEWVALGNIPLDGPVSFQTLKQTGDNGTGVIVALAASAGSSWVVFSGRLFAIFAVVTSFLGVSLALNHFFSDAIKMDSIGKKRCMLALMTYIPPLMITYAYPTAFVQLLSFAGIFVALLLGLFPALMVFKTRDPLFMGRRGGLMMVCVSLFFILVIVQEIINLIGS